MDIQTILGRLSPEMQAAYKTAEAEVSAELADRAAKAEKAAAEYEGAKTALLAGFQATIDGIDDPEEFAPLVGGELRISIVGGEDGAVGLVADYRPAPGLRRRSIPTGAVTPGEPRRRRVPTLPDGTYDGLMAIRGKGVPVGVIVADGDVMVRTADGRILSPTAARKSLSGGTGENAGSGAAPGVLTVGGEDVYRFAATE